MPLNRNDERQWQRIQAMEWACKGYTYREISEKTGVNIAIISKILHDINEEARSEIKSWLNELMPLEYKKSLLLNQYIHKKAMEMAETIKDERVRCQALGILAETDEKKRNLLTDSYVLDITFDTMKSHKIKEHLDELKKEARSNENMTYEDTYDNNNNSDNNSKGQHSEMVDR
jgi:transcriptional regulator with XRE-family HTH domain